MRVSRFAIFALLSAAACFRPALAQGGLETGLLQNLSAEDRQRALQALQNGRGESSDLGGTGTVTAGNQDASARLAARERRRRGAGLAELSLDEQLLAGLQRQEAFDPATNLPLFGYELFSDDGNSFDPPTDLPAPSEYVLGPGDVVRVQMFGNQNETMNLLVTRDGLVNFPRLGPIQVAGLRLDDARQVIERRVEKELIGVQTNITLGPLRGIQIFLLGDARRPGAYSVSGLGTISHALFSGGGVTAAGSLRAIQLKRGGRVIRTLDLYDFLLRGDASNDVRLQSGDAIFIPPVGGRVAVAGAVKRPAVYELKGATRLGAVLGLAGGLSAEARRGQVVLERVNRDGQRTLVELDLSATGVSETEVRDGDRLFVQPVSGQVDNRVTVLGHVRYPNRYAWAQDLRLSRLLALAQVRPSQPGQEIYPLMGLIERSNPASGLREWSGFDLFAVQAGRNDQVLMPEDRVLILNRSHTDYLASPEVSAALRGELPKPAHRRQQRNPGQSAASGAYDPAGEVSGDGAQGSGEPAAGRSPAAQRDEPDLGSPFGQKPRLRSQASEPCPALAEVAKISNSARALTIRMLLSAQESPQTDPNAQPSQTQAQANIGLSGAESSSRSQIPNTVPESAAPQRLSEALRGVETSEPLKDCPEVFEQAPTALVYLLERGVGLIGEVRRPGLYPVPDGIDYARLLESAGGLTAEADSARLDVFTAVGAAAGSAARFTAVDLATAPGAGLVRPGEIYQLRPGRSLPEVGAISLRGEVRFPGRYLISRGERLADLIGRAGGLSEAAYPFGAVFTRESARRAEADSNRRAANDLRDALATATTKGLLNQPQGQSSAFLADLIQRLETTPPVGRIVIEADPAVLALRPEDNLLLEPGDELYIPKRPSAVTVTGQVLNPGTLAFRANAGSEHYLGQAGGYSKSADEERLFLVLPNGSARPLETSFWNYRQESIPPGSVIVVPRDAAPLTGLLLTERIAGIVANLALSAAALVTINN